MSAVTVIVAVTGAAGFIGSHVVSALLSSYPSVDIHATVSAPRSTPHLLSLRVRIFCADLCSSDGGESSFRAAFDGCVAVIHCASPYDLAAPPEQQISPSLRGTEAAVKAAIDTLTVRRIILTSSAAAVYYAGLPMDHVYTEDDWSKESILRESKSFYALGKLLAEKRAWELTLSNDAIGHRKELGIAPLTMAAICPTQTLGPLLIPPVGGLNQSMKLLADLWSEGASKLVLPAKGKCLVDVRDVALAHVLSIGLGVGDDLPSFRTCFTVCDAEGVQKAPERFLLVAGSLPWRYIANQCRAAIPYAAIATTVAPGHTLPQAFCSTARVWRLGVRYRPLEETLIDAARSIAHYQGLTIEKLSARVPPTLLIPHCRVLELLADIFSSSSESSGRQGRILIGIAGVPGSGKSTFATDVSSRLQAAFVREGMDPSVASKHIVVLGMDGFHLTRDQLSAMPNHVEAFKRRGAPWTFDANGCISRLRSVKFAGKGEDVCWPSFDHAIKDPINGDIVVPFSAAVILIEGIYVLHPGDGFAPLRALIDEGWYLDTPPELSHARLRARHMAAWGFTEAEAEERIATNDGLNAIEIAKSRCLADFCVNSY